MKCWNINEYIKNIMHPALTLGSSQHKAKSFIVFFLQEDCLLLDYVVTEWKKER